MRRTENPENMVRIHEVPLDTLGRSPAATRTDCKSVVIRLRRFESYRPNNMESVAQLVEHWFVDPVVTGSNPV